MRSNLVQVHPIYDILICRTQFERGWVSSKEQEQLFERAEERTAQAQAQALVRLLMQVRARVEWMVRAERMAQARAERMAQEFAVRSVGDLFFPLLLDCRYP